ncbi:TetR/AcrR family transcriptional regulator [Aquihabitans sp. McL0605]|uniref:TetR/AcrR family transcriptional regulator n=1 Tax=Aquihabitans sp. McL0605 TaxID=3415671 RepID=UPI003CF589DE
MVQERRPRASTEAKRRRILDATEELILESGYAAVSSRSVAGRVDMQAPHLHYYFGTIDDLFVAVLHRRSSGAVERMAEALDSSEPLRSWWEIASDRRGTALFVELLAAANHRPALKSEMAAMAKEVRALQMERLGVLLDEYGLDSELLAPVLVAAAMQGLAFAVVTDQAAGYDTHPDEAAAAMDRLVADLEARRARRTAP